MTVIARLVVADDAAEILRLRVLMFESMGVDPSAGRLAKGVSPHLKEGLAEGVFSGLS